MDGRDCTGILGISDGATICVAKQKPEISYVNLVWVKGRSSDDIVGQVYSAMVRCSARVFVFVFVFVCSGSVCFCCCCCVLLLCVVVV